MKKKIFMGLFVLATVIGMGFAYPRPCSMCFGSGQQTCTRCYGNVYSKIGIKNRFEINNDSPKTAVKRLIKEYGLSE